MAKNTAGSIRAQRFTMDVVVHSILLIMSVIWLIPFVFLVAQSFRGGVNQTMFSTEFFPKTVTFDAYVKLFTYKEKVDFPRMFMNTLLVSSVSCVISSFLVLAVSYCLSRVKWKLRRTYMNFAMVITLFPGFMAMVAVYYLLKTFGLTDGDKTLLGLILIYSSGAGVGFHVMKGYMDTIPKALDEAAYLDGATKFQSFTRITIPLCKPMIVYQVITSFMGPWCDFITPTIVCGTDIDHYTVSVGLNYMLSRELKDTHFTMFCAGAVLIAIPIATLFIITQKFYQEAMSGSVKG